MIQVIQEVDTNTGMALCNEVGCPTMSAGRYVHRGRQRLARILISLVSPIPGSRMADQQRSLLHHTLFGFNDGSLARFTTRKSFLPNHLQAFPAPPTPLAIPARHQAPPQLLSQQVPPLSTSLSPLLRAIRTSGLASRQDSRKTSCKTSRALSSKCSGATLTCITATGTTHSGTSTVTLTLTAVSFTLSPWRCITTSCPRRTWSRSRG